MLLAFYVNLSYIFNGEGHGKHTVKLPLITILNIFCILKESKSF